jgi:transposase InsO family protein
MMCRVLDVSVSGYYAWKKRPVCTRKREDGELTRRITQTFTTYRGVYGSLRIQAELRDQGFRCGRTRIARLMREAHLCVRPRPARHWTTHRDPTATARIAPNVLNREFTAPAANVKWVADVTYIPTRQGWLYLAVVLDLFSRFVVGWAMAETDDAHLVQEALRMALGRREPQAELLHHSDQGSEYTSDAYLALLKSRGIQLSMSRTGNCYDNAVMERFFGTLKRECPMAFATRQQARSAIFDYIECFYNRVRRHSTLGYLSPLAFELSKR